MLDERRADHVEVEVLSLSPPRVRIRGPPLAAAEAARELLLRDAGTSLAEGVAVEETYGRDDAPVPGAAAMMDWLRDHAGQPYTLIDLVSQMTRQPQDSVRERFYVRAGRDKRRVGSDYRAICVSRHRTCLRELEAEGWRVAEERQSRGPTRFRILPPEETDAA